MVSLLLVAYIFISQDKDIKLPIEKKVVVQKRVESLEQVEKDVLENKIEPNKKVIFYSTKEINTTMKTEINLTSEFDENGEDYSYIWKKKENIIGFGRNIKKAFSLGEHNLSCQVFEKGILLANEPINVIAWRYVKEEDYYFDTDINNYSLNYIKFFNYLKQLILEFDNDSFRTEFIYNEYGKVTEERHEDFSYAEFNYIITNSYDEEKLVSMEKTDNEGNIIKSHIYDKEGKEIEQEVDENSSIEEEQTNSNTPKKYIKVYNQDGNLTHIESPNGKYIRNMKYDNGKLIYEEDFFSDGGKTTETIRYDKNGNKNYREYLQLDEEGYTRRRDIITEVYSDDGNLIRQEEKYFSPERKHDKEVLSQHVISKWSYKNGKELSYQAEALVGVISPCSGKNNVKEEYIYHYDKNGSLLSSDYKYQKRGESELKEFKDFKKYKVVKTYTNDLE